MKRIRIPAAALVELDIHAYIDACANGWFSGRNRENGYSALERATPDLHRAIPMTFSSVKKYFENVILSHPGTGSQGGKYESAVQTANRHVYALVKCGALKVVG